MANFMDTPLVVWCQTFRPEKQLSYEELFDGVYLSQIMKEIDSKCTTEGINLAVEDVRDRVHNWDILMKNIKAYYKEVLQQMIVMKLPSIVTLSKLPESDQARAEMTRVLLLVLGCAIQSEDKEFVVENIKSLDVHIQHAIMEYIKEITDDTKNVFAIEVPLDQMDDVSCNMFSHLNMLIQERDGYVEEIKDLTQTLEEVYHTQQAAQQELQTQKASLSISPGTPGPHSSGPTTASTTPEKHHLAVELAETKAKLRKLRQELEDKTEMSTEIQEELDELKVLSSKLRTENLELVQDARAARTYRDEVDILKEKANRVDRYELEISRYKEKLNELDFYKARVEELREDNQVLVDTKLMLEEQLHASHKRVEAVIHVEDDLIKYKQHVEELVQEREVDRQKMQQIIEHNAQVEFEKKSSFNENANLEEELVKARRQLNVGLSTSINEQVSNSANSRILKLELEKQKLQQQLDELQETLALDNNTKLLELEKENLRLSKKVDTLQSNSSQEVQGMLELEHKTLSLSREREKLQQTIETIKEAGERHIMELQRENAHLQQTVATLRDRNEKTQDLRVKDIERENKRLHESVNQYNTKLSEIEFEKFQLQKSCDKIQDNSDKIQYLEDDNLKVEHENDELTKRVATLQLTCDKYEKLEQEASDLRMENIKMSKGMDSLKTTITKLKALEQDNINLTVETQSLQRKIKTMQNSSSLIVTMEQEKHELNEQIQHLNRTVETYKSEHSKQGQLENDMYELDTENQKLQRNLEGITRKLEVLQMENTELESKNVQFQKASEHLKMATKRINSLEKESQQLESENNQLLKSKDRVEKENKRLKQLVERQDAQIDEFSTKVSCQERENKNLMRLAENAEDGSERLQESEQENMELVRQSAMDKKALSTLREDLVSEKLKCQQLSNDLDKLSSELSRLGLNREKLMAAVQAEDHSKIKALECMLDDTFKKSLTIKEEKILVLESRLNESMNRNRELEDDVKTVRIQNEAIQQRREEERHLANNPYDRLTGDHAMSMPSATKELLELKDHMIAVERKNATLEAECSNQRTHNSQQQEHLRRTESQLSKLQNQISTFQTQTFSLQAQLAKHQVDNKTLQSQNASLMAQNSSLQKDISRIELEKERLHGNYDDLNSKHEDYLADHSTLERLHEQVTKEYEEMISEHGSLKANFKSLKQAYEDLVDQNAAMSRERQAVAQLKQIIQQDQKNMKTDNEHLSQLQMEYVKLKEENVGLQNDKGRIDRKYDALLTDHKTMKQEYNSLRAKLSELQREYGECKDQLNTMDVEINKLINKCESLNQMNLKLEEDNRALMMQLQALLTQNQELLVSTLESKDHFHEEQKTYLEKMAELKRQKEKLEEKIMEQYRRYDPVKKKSRSFGANLMRKAKQMVSRNKSRERSKTPGENSFAHDSAENSSLGSGSLGDNPELGDRGRPKMRKGRYRRGSSNALANQNKALAKSTTALNLEGSPSRSLFALRGAKSSENLTVELMRRSDVDSMSSSSDMKNTEWSARPSRRRTLMADSSSNLNTSGDYRRNGSLSSEDTRSSTGPRLDLIPANPKKGRDMAVGDDYDDDEDDDDGMITLSEFLNEMDKSPKSRRKYIKKTKAEEPSKKSDTQTSILSPTLGPRSPLIENDENKSQTKLKSRNWKSELNISQLSRINSAGSAFTTFDRRHQMQPQYNVAAIGMTTPTKADSCITDQVTSTPMPVLHAQSGGHVVRSSSERDRDGRPHPVGRDGSYPSQKQPQPLDSSYSSERDRSYSSADRDRHRSQSSVNNQDQSPQTPVQRLFSVPSGSPHYGQRTSDLETRYMNGQVSASGPGMSTPDGNRRLGGTEYGNHGNTSSGPPITTRSPVRPVSSLGIPLHQSPQQLELLPSTRERERSQTPSMGRQSSSSSIGSGSIGAYNAMTRQTSGNITPQRQDSHNQQNPPNGGRSLPRQPSGSSTSSSSFHRADSSHRPDSQHHNDGTHRQEALSRSEDSRRQENSHYQNSRRFENSQQNLTNHQQDVLDHSLSDNSQHRNDSSHHHLNSSHNGTDSYIQNNNNKYNNSDQSYIPGAGQRALPRPPGHNDSGSGYPPPMRPQHNPINNDSMDQSGYNPGNVRSLVQSYQKTQNQLSGASDPDHSGSGPVPPPRRVRPMSAGPIRSGSGSAFTIPPRSTTPGPEYRSTTPGPEYRSTTPGPEYRSTTPVSHDIPRPHSAHPESRSRTLPQPPTERQTTTGLGSPPGNTNSSSMNISSGMTGSSWSTNGPMHVSNKGPNGGMNGPTSGMNGPARGMNGPSGGISGPSSGMNGPTGGMNGPPGATPPRPQSASSGKPKNPVWYEYGCV